MPRDTTRFVIEAGSERMRLLSVRENADGRLIITTHCAGMFRFDAKIKDQKHSIHRSRESLSRAITIHRTTTFSNAPKPDLYLMTHAIRDRRFQPIAATPVSHGNFSTSPFKDLGDAIINLGEYEPKRVTLHYALRIMDFGCRYI